MRGGAAAGCTAHGSRLKQAWTRGRGEVREEGGRPDRDQGFRATQTHRFLTWGTCTEAVEGAAIKIKEQSALSRLADKLGDYSCRS